MKYDKIRKNPSQVLGLTGFTVSEFEALLPCFKSHWDEFNEQYTLERKPRERRSYNRRSSVLPLTSDKLLFILSYLKNNPLQDYHAAMFEMTQPQCNLWIQRLLEILLKTMKSLGNLPDKDSLRMVNLLSKCENKLLDEPEKPTPRRQEIDFQKYSYRGRKNG